MRTSPSVHWDDHWLVANVKHLLEQRDVDKWAESTELYDVFARYRRETGHAVSDSEIYAELMSLRKFRSEARSDGLKLPTVIHRQPPVHISISDEEKELLVRLYDAQELPRDRLPFTKQMDEIIVKFQASGSQLSRHQIMQKLLALGKAQELPTRGRSYYNGRHLPKDPEEGFY